MIIPKTKPPGFKIIGCITFLLFTMCYAEAQTRTTNEAKVILVVNKVSNEITNIELFNTQITENEMSKKYLKSMFFLGLFKGRYALNNNAIIPKSESILTVFTDKLLFSNTEFSPGKNLMIGSLKTQEISRKKGELILKIK
jgi:hypothetical protein